MIFTLFHGELNKHCSAGSMIWLGRVRPCPGSLETAQCPTVLFGWGKLLIGGKGWGEYWVL